MCGKIIFLAINFIIIAAIQCLVLVPERANVTEISNKYITYGRLYITRVSRKSPYFINVEGQIKHMWGNNITAELIFYEYLHNEYRRTFVEIHARGCDIINKDLVIGTMLHNVGVSSCPIPAGKYHLYNMSVPMTAINFQLPFHKFRIDMMLKHTDTKELIARGFLNAVFKDK